MTGLRRVFLTTGCGACLLTGCSNKLEDALPLAERNNHADPKTDSLYAKALAADQAGKSEKAIKLYRTMANTYPGSPKASTARFRQATLLEHEGELLDAFDAYQQVIHRYQSTALYPEARDKQAIVAHKASEGLIKNSFFGIKSRLESKTIVEMLEKVRDNAPQSASAPKAQFTIGEVLENRKKLLPAIAAYQKVVDDYPKSSLAPDSYYRIGHILLTSAAGGNQNQANLDRALHTFEDLRQSYPGTKRAADAALKITEIKSRDIQRSFDIAEFYFKKRQNSSAAFYYQEVLSKTKGGALHNKAQQRLQLLGSGN
jgi:outer membrane protein assembly factor BamD